MLDWKASPNIEAVKQKRTLHPGAKNSVHFGNFPNPRPDKIHYKLCCTTTDKEQEQLATEGTCFLCKQSGHIASDCTKAKICSNTMQVRDELRYKIKYARLIVEDEKTSSLQVAKLPTDKRMH